MKKSSLIEAGIIIVITSFYFLTVSAGHNWGDDFAMYITHANNIVHGWNYADSHYIYNPNFPDLGPKAYPPVFPLLLAPVVAIAGINLFYLKFVGIICFIAFLIVFTYNISARSLKPSLRILLVVSIGFLPLFWLTSDEILSDLPFLLICTISLVQIQSLNRNKSNNQPYIAYFLSGILIYLAYATRSIGIVLIPVMVAFELFSKRKFTFPLILTILTSVILILLQGRLLPEIGGYIDQLPGTASELIGSIQRLVGYYIKIYPRLFPVENALWRSIVSTIILILVVVGITRRLKREVTVYEVFFLLYFSALLLWPSVQGLRFLIPIVPLFFLYAFEGTQWILDSVIKNQKIANICIMAVFGVVAFAFYSYYQKALPRPVGSEITDSATIDMFDFGINETGSDDVIAFFKPRALSLFTNRSSLAITGKSYCDQILEMKKFNVKYLIIDHENDPKEWHGFDISYPENFEVVFKNEGFKIFRVLYRGKCISY